MVDYPDDLPLGPLGRPNSRRAAIIRHNRKIWRARAARNAKTAPYEPSDEFFKSKAWLELRYRVLKQHGARCQCCGRSRKDLDDAGEPVRIQVDHIKPRSKYPELALAESNCQILCASCNEAKSSTDETDWRN